MSTFSITDKIGILYKTLKNNVLSVIKLNVITLRVVAPFSRNDNHFTHALLEHREDIFLLQFVNIR
jgi:hypothetical protein